jgi:hypothetical protein
MNLDQSKLSKSEWDSIEIPVSDDEKKILKLIISGFSDVNIRFNDTNSLFTFLKLDYSIQLEEFLFNKHFADKIKVLINTYKISYIKIAASKISRSDSVESVEETKDVNADGDQVCTIKVGHIVKLKSSDQIRIGRSDLINEEVTEIYEFVLLKHMEKMFHYKAAKNTLWQFHYFTLSKLLLNNIEKVNRFVKMICETAVANLEKCINLLDIIRNSYEYIERNSSLLKYGDMSLYQHQKDIFVTMKSRNPKLVLYIAPTGTGKTLTPLGLSEGNKIIFVCAARHVGIALARAAISVNKRIAFAFGCSSASDIRLHYFAAKEFTRDKRTGSIKKVDNSIGDKVEIIICDIRSYLPAMYYMTAFNKPEDIITYWDEPTITMDYAEHNLHSIIKENWKQNVIPNMVLSSATLPKIHELKQTVADFTVKFADYKYIVLDGNDDVFVDVKQAEVCSIVSHDCRKTIPILNNNGYIVMPHYITGDYDELSSIVENCEENMTLLRYFDLNEAATFIIYVEEHNLTKSAAKCSRSFETVHDINMQSVKLHYLKTLKHVKPEEWVNIYIYFSQIKQKKLLTNTTIDAKGNKLVQTTSVDSLSLSLSKPKPGSELTRLSSSVSLINPVHTTAVDPDGTSGIFVTTKDAYTLTDGPTIFLATDVTKVAKFCIQQANIPASVMKEIQDKIDFNNKVNAKINILEAELENLQDKMPHKGEDVLGGTVRDRKERSREKGSDGEAVARSKDKNDKTNAVQLTSIVKELDLLKSMIKTATLNELFIPNKKTHKSKWAEGLKTATSFSSDIDDVDIISIMMLQDIEDSWKILLLLGIGVFTKHKSIEYTEIMKRLADTQKLFLIIADSDYIYGTNYQFCHGYLSKDLFLTQEKIIQALGRIGRNNIQQEYSARFRDDEHVKMLFRKTASESKPEVINMNKLFNSKNVVWDIETLSYIELPEEEESVANGYSNGEEDEDSDEY